MLIMPAGPSLLRPLSRKERLGKGGGLDGHDHFIFEHVAPACGNLCRALGEDFAMFLPVVLPPLLAALEAEVKFSMEAADPDDDGEVSFAPATATSKLDPIPSFHCTLKFCGHPQVSFEALFTSRAWQLL